MRLTLPEFRRDLLDLVSRAVPMVENEADADERLPEGGVPTAVLIVVEWQGDDGRRWLSRLAVLGSGDPAPPWTQRMLAGEAVEWDRGDGSEDHL